MELRFHPARGLKVKKRIYSPPAHPYMGRTGMYDPKGFGFLVVLVRNRISILAILVSIEAGICTLVRS